MAMNYFIMEESASIFMKNMKQYDDIYSFGEEFHKKSIPGGDPLQEFGEDLETAKKDFAESWKYDEFYMNNSTMYITRYYLVGVDEDDDRAGYDYIDVSVPPQEIWIYGAKYILYFEDDMSYELKREYTVKPEFRDMWFGDRYGSQVDLSDIEDLAEEWEKPIEELMEEVEEN